MKMIKMSEKKSMKGMKWIVVLLAVFLVAGVFVGAAAAGTITVSSTDHGSITSPTNGTSVDSGQTVSIVVSPESGYEVNTVTAGSEQVTKESENSYSFTMPDTDVTVTATFKQIPKYNVMVSSSITNGTVRPDKETAAAGETVTLTVTPVQGYEVKTVTAGSTAATKSGEGQYTFSMPSGDVTVSAEFQQISKYTVTISDSITNGTVSPNKQTAAENETVTLTATPSSGYELKTLTVTKASGGTVTVGNDKTFQMPAENVTVTAEFQQITITSVTITGLTPLSPAQAISSKTAASLTISGTSPTNHTGDLSVSSLTWKKAGTAVTTGNFEAGITYTAEFTLQPAANSGVTISPTATVTVDGTQATYDAPTKKVIVNLQANAKTSISAIALDVASTPAGEQNAPNITIASSDPNKDNLSISTTWKKKGETSAVTGKLDYNTEYIATAEITVKSDKTAAYELASSVNVTKPDKTTDTPKTVAVALSGGKLTVSITFKTAVDKEIDTVSLTMTAPSAGSTVSTQTSLVKPETSANYTVYSLKWYSGTKELTTSDKFEYGTKYTAKIVLKTTDDYVFNSGIKKSDVKVNSNTVDKDPSLTDSSKTLTLEYTFTEAAKPTVTLTANPSSPKIGVGQTSVAVQFSYTITGDYGSATINFGDGSAASTLSSKSGTASHTYTGTGPYTVTITVKDASGVLLSSGKLNITVGKDTLTAGFTATPASDNPQKISFTGTTSGTVSKWEWDLGDGTKMNEESFTHTYKKAGDYTVTLTVYSGELSDTTSKTLTVVKGTGDDEPFLIIGDTEVPSPLDIIAEFVRLLLSLFNFEEHPLFPDFGE